MLKFTGYFRRSPMAAAFLALFLCLPSAALAAVVNLGGTNYLLRDHPRILATSDTLPGLRAKAVSSNPLFAKLNSHLRAERAAKPNFLDPKLSMPLPPADWNRSYDMYAFALAYMVGPTGGWTPLAGKSEAQTTEDYGQAAREIMLSIASLTESQAVGSYQFWDAGRHTMRYMAMAYDWVYPLLSEADKDKILKWVNEVLYPNIQKSVTDYSHTAANPDLTHNLFETQLVSYMMFALATYEDNQPGMRVTPGATPMPGANSFDMLQYGFNEWFEHQKPVYDKYFVGGHTFSGSAYGYGRAYPYAVLYCILLEQALGMDTWSETRWEPDVVDYFIHATLPWDNKSPANWGNAKVYSDGNVGGGTWSTLLLQSLFLGTWKYPDDIRAKHSTWFLKNVMHLDERGYLYLPIPHIADFFLLGPDNLGDGVDFTATSNTHYLASGVDVFFSRARWNDSATTWTGFAASKAWLGDHQGTNWGSYKIYKKQHLLYENGASGNGMRDQNNIIVLDDGYVRDVWNTKRFSAGFDFWLKGVPITGIDRAGGDQYAAYARADITGAYVNNPSQKKLEKFTREFVQLKPLNEKDDDYVIVFDRIHSYPKNGSAVVGNSVVDNGREVEKSFLNHFPAMPTVTGDIISVTGPAAPTKLLVKVLLPLNPTITPSKQTDSTSDVTGDEPWRVTIKAPTAAEFENFLVVYLPTGKLEAALPATTLLSAETVSGTSPNVVGVQITDATANKVVLFSTDFSGADIAGEITYRVNGLAKTDEHLLLGVAPNQKFSVTYTQDGLFAVKPDQSGTVVSSEAGILRLHIDRPLAPKNIKAAY